MWTKDVVKFNDSFGDDQLFFVLHCVLFRIGSVSDCFAFRVVLGLYLIAFRLFYWQEWCEFKLVDFMIQFICLISWVRKTNI